MSGLCYRADQQPVSFEGVCWYCGKRVLFVGKIKKRKQQYVPVSELTDYISSAVCFADLYFCMVGRKENRVVNDNFRLYSFLV